MALVLGALAWTQPDVTGSDLWWHLAAGREIVEQGAPPSHDSFSYSFHGREWLNHEWLWDAGAWQIHAAAPQALAWANLAVLTALFALLLRVSSQVSGSLFAAGLALWGVAATSHWFFDIRPHLFTLLFVTIVMATRDRPARVWLWPGLMAVWANLHGGFVFGVGMIGLLTAGHGLAASRQAGRPRLPARDALTLGLCLAAWLANPWGLRILDYPLQYLNAASPYRNILEWHAPGFSIDPRDFAGRFFWLSLFVAAGLPRMLRREPALAALALVTFAMAASSRRFIPLFAIASAPTLALAVDAARRVWTARGSRLGSPAVAWAATAAAAVAAVALWHPVRLQPDLLGRWTLRDRYPDAAVRTLRALGPPGRVLNEYAWGGYVMLHLPETQVFIDGRANTLYDDDFFLEARSLRRLEPGWEDIVTRHPADAALLIPGPLSAGLQGLRKPWTAVYRDSVAVVLLPPGSPLAARAPAVNDELAATPAFYEERAHRALLAGDIPAAIRVVESELERDPLRIAAWAQLALLHASRGDVAALEGAIDAGLAANPRRWSDLYRAKASAYQRAGDSNAAERAARRSTPRGPFARSAAP